MPGKKYRPIRFQGSEATSCGIYVDSLDRRDVLGWNEKTGALQDKRGQGKSTGGVDRLELVRAAERAR